MGLLDDAIRDHLDLKRRHGADPDEVSRAEREALGPVRRGPEDVAAEPNVLDDQLEHDDQLAPDRLSDDRLEQSEQLPYEDEEEWSEWDEEEQPAVPGADAERAPEPPLAAPATHEAEEYDAEEHEAELHESEVQEPEQASQKPAVFDHGEETAEYDVEGELKKESERQGDEILEETPEFLQDTPEHDRLWFEQKPPRDFDFDG